MAGQEALMAASSGGVCDVITLFIILIGEINLRVV
jgi:hypothetical protein